jgi:hypothetical protein
MRFMGVEKKIAIISHNFNIDKIMQDTKYLAMLYLDFCHKNSIN